MKFIRVNEGCFINPRNIVGVRYRNAKQVWECISNDGGYGTIEDIKAFGKEVGYDFEKVVKEAETVKDKAEEPEKKTEDKKSKKDLNREIYELNMELFKKQMENFSKLFNVEEPKDDESDEEE